MTQMAPERLMDVLRGDRARRPRRDDTLAAGLRATLEDRVYEILGPARRDAPVAVSSATLRGTGNGLELFDSTLSRARGVMISTAFRLVVAQVHVEDPYDDAMGAWRGERPHDELLEAVAHLDNDQVARLRADVNSHFATLTTALGPIPSSWWPRTSQRAYQLLGGGNVHLRDIVDLVVGSTHHEVASVALVDITTSPLGPGAERVMRYHALMQTLRSSVVPLRTSIFSSATGQLWTLDVDTELLMRAVDDVAGIVTRVRAES